MTASISFIHAADLHLDSPFRGLRHVPDSIFPQIQESTFKALDKLIEQAIFHNVDFVLLVGDLYDNEKQSLKAQVRLRNAFEKLKENNINVFLSYGNHDYINDNHLPVPFPDNVHVFSNETVSRFSYKRLNENEIIANIYGFSYEHRAVQESKISEYTIVGEEIPYHIATLHGSLATNTEHDVYAPFQIGELKRTGMDYWALGHIHKREELHHNPPIIYPGNTQGRHRKETGEKGCYLVEMDGERIDKRFISLESIRLEKVNVDVSHCEHIHDIEKEILHALPQLDKATLIDLHINLDLVQREEWEETDIYEWVEIINEMIVNQSPWMYIYRTSLLFPEEDDQIWESDPFFQEIEKQVNVASVRSIIDDLYQHKLARKYIHTLSETDEEEIKKEAEILLKQAFRKG